MSEVCVLAPAFAVTAVLARGTPLAFTLAFVCALALVLSEVCDCALVTPGATLKPRFESAFEFELCFVLALTRPPALVLVFVLVRVLALESEFVSALVRRGATLKSRFTSALVFAVCVVMALSTPRVLVLALALERSLAFVLEFV